MFSQKEFIEASRKFVCVRLESYESQEHQDLVRSLLNGRFANTAFCILAPDGKERLSRTGRGPEHGLSAGRPGPDNEPSAEEVIKALENIAMSYRPRGDEKDATLQDFHTFRQALNVAAGDQRLLLFVAAADDDQAKVKQTLKPVFADDEVIGKFHLDFADTAKDAAWAENIERTRGKSGLVIVHADPFGQSGRVVEQLPLTASAEEIKTALLKANTGFSLTEERKVYSEHVDTGRRERIFFENEMPYGEDRDGDGKIDSGGGKGGDKGGKGKGSKGKGRP